MCYQGFLKAPPAGLEPATNGLTVLSSGSENNGKSTVCGGSTANTQQGNRKDEDLELVLDRWHTLPDEIKAAIACFVKPSS